jgi:hypothetical protein
LQYINRKQVLVFLYGGDKIQLSKLIHAEDNGFIRIEINLPQIMEDIEDSQCRVTSEWCLDIEAFSSIIAPYSIVKVMILVHRIWNNGNK